MGKRSIFGVCLWQNPDYVGWLVVNGPTVHRRSDLYTVVLILKCLSRRFKCLSGLGGSDKFSRRVTMESGGSMSDPGGISCALFQGI